MEYKLNKEYKIEDLIDYQESPPLYSDIKMKSGVIIEAFLTYVNLYGDNKIVQIKKRISDENPISLIKEDIDIIIFKEIKHT